MPRNITNALRALFRGTTFMAAICVKITTPSYFDRVLGFTTWDSDIVFGGITYEAQNAITGSAISSAIGTGVDNLEVTGLLVSVSITDADVYAGVYDASTLEMFIVNPLDLTMLSMVLINGVLGDFKTSDGKFVVELRSLTQLMSQQVGENVAPSCQVAQFGDGRCKFDAVGGVDTSGHPVRSLGTVTVVEDNCNLRLSGIVTSGGFYTYGIIKFVTGLNAGLSTEIKLHGVAGSVITNNIWSSPNPPGDVPFNTNTSSSWVTQCGTNFSFLIPPGTWSSAYISSQERWWLNNASNQGTNGLYILISGSDQYLLAEEGWGGEYQHNVALEAPSITAINALSTTGGGILYGCLQFWEATGINLLGVNVQELLLTLSGSPSVVSDLVQLGEPMPYPVSPGDTAYLTGGCDRLSTTCKNKWNNIVNFRGFPYVPGIDLLLKAGGN